MKRNIIAWIQHIKSLKSHKNEMQYTCSLKFELVLEKHLIRMSYPITAFWLDDFGIWLSFMTMRTGLYI